MGRHYGELGEKLRRWKPNFVIDDQGTPTVDYAYWIASPGTGSYAGRVI